MRSLIPFYLPRKPVRVDEETESLSNFSKLTYVKSNRLKIQTEVFKTLYKTVSYYSVPLFQICFLKIASCYLKVK